MADRSRIQEFDRKVGVHRDKGDCVPAAMAKAAKETWSERRKDGKS